jgi:hypothetical protein
VTGTVERAYELAGTCASLQQLRARLAAEGYSGVRNHLDGAAIRHALTALCSAGKRSRSIVAPDAL